MEEAPTQRLPQDVIVDIFDKVDCGDRFTRRRPKEVLWQFARVCHSWRRILLPFLFSFLNLNLTLEAHGKSCIETARHRLRTLLDIIKHNSAIAPFVRQLELIQYCGEAPVLGDPENSGLLLQLVQHLTNLTSFEADTRVAWDEERYITPWWSAITPSAREAVAQICHISTLQRLEIDAIIPLSIYIHHPTLQSLIYHGNYVLPDNVPRAAVSRPSQTPPPTGERALPMVTNLQLRSNFSRLRGEVQQTSNAYMIHTHPQIFTHLTSLGYSCTCEDDHTHLLPQILDIAGPTLTSFFCYTELAEADIDLSPLTQLRRLYLSYEISIKEGVQYPLQSVFSALSTVPMQQLRDIYLSLDMKIHWRKLDPIALWHAIDALIAENASSRTRDVHIAIAFSGLHRPDDQPTIPYLHCSPETLAPRLHERYEAGTIARLDCGPSTSWIH